MKRLTRRICGRWGVVEGCELDTMHGLKAVVDRLAAYEVTGLEPEEIRVLTAIHGLPAQEIVRICELYQADKDGRLVVLPCKPGDILWQRSPITGEPIQFQAPDIHWIIDNLEEFGKTIFLSREEAEAALKGSDEG